MWAEIVKHLPDFPSAVLTGVDATGYPFSARCVPRLDAEARAVRVDVPEGGSIRPGPACLLCHKHDQRLWNLKSCVVRGRLERDGRGWLLRPCGFIPGMGIGGLWGYVRLLRGARRSTRRYLARRGLPRPRIPWDEVRALMEQANAGG